MGKSEEEGGQSMAVVSAGLTWQGAGCMVEWGRTNKTKNLLYFPTGVEVSQEHITIQAQVRNERVSLPLCSHCGGVRRARGREKVDGGGTGKCLELKDVNLLLSKAA